MISSYRYKLLSGLFWMILIGTTNAQQSSQQQSQGSPPPTLNRNSQYTRIAIINTDLFYDPNNGITRLVDSMRGLDQEFQSRKVDLQRLQQRIEQLTNETEERAPGVTPLTIQTKLNELEQVKRNSKRKIEDTQAEYGKRLRDAMNPVLDDL